MMAPTKTPVHLYPQPLTIARGAQECERALRGDLTAYSAVCATWGRMGGLETLRRYGRDHYRRMALYRWGKVGAAELTMARSAS